MSINRQQALVFVLGVIGAVTLAVLLAVLMMRPALADLMYLILLLTAVGLAAILLAYISARMGWWRKLPSLSAALTLGYVLAAALTVLAVWLTAKLMFINAHDLILALILMAFASGISVAFGFFTSAAVTSDLTALETGAARVSEGDFEIKVPVAGRDEVARLAQSFNEMAARLSVAAAEKDALEATRRNLVAWASHDLRTPLASLRAMIDALADGMVDDEETVTRYYAQSQAEIKRMSALIDDLFELASLDAGHLTLHGETGSLSDLISDALSAFTLRATEKEINLRGEVMLGLDPVFMAPDKIARVLDNLLENALRHTPRGGEVCISAGRVENLVTVSIQDNGEGIAPEDLPQIFERFYRGEKSRSRGGYDRGGAGLGLAIVRGIVEAHGGTIHAESIPGSSTTISFTLPVPSA